jgi:hypothetical protein
LVDKENRQMKGTVSGIAISIAFLCLAVAQTSNVTQAPLPGDSLEQSFMPGGTVRMKLSAGAYEIRPGPDDNKIRIRWTTKRSEQLKKVRAHVELKGSEALITTHGSKHDFHVEIELPAHSDLIVRLSTGDIDIRGMEGNKDVQCHAGDISIDIGRAQDYRQIDVSVKVGDIEAPPISVSKGGFFRSTTWPGTGKYSLHAHVGAGSLTLLGVK